MSVTRSFKTSSCASAATAGLIGACLFVATAAATAAAVVDPELLARLARDQGQAQRYPVLLKLAQQSDLAAISARFARLPQAQRGGRLLEALKADVAPRQAALLADLKARGALDVMTLATVNAVAAQVTKSDVQALAARADVVAIRYDLGLLAPSRRLMPDACNPARPTPPQRLPKHCRAGAAPPALVVAGAAFDPALPAAPTPTALGAPALWQAGFTGKGVTVAMVDTGVDPKHPDLGGSFRGGAGDWFDIHGEHKQPVDKHGHGTQIAGLVVGAGASGQTLGMAPQAKWIAARVYNDRNVGRLSDLHRIMAWLLDPDGNPATADAPQIVLNAWGLGDRPGSCDEEFATDLRWLRAAGMHVVFAAGNGGPNENSSLSPANNVGALAVGALDSAGQLALTSSRGVSSCDARPYPDVAAPGELLRTTDLSAGKIPITTLASGTSYAAAVVAGQLALLLQAKPALTPAERETLLRAVPGDERPPLLRALGLSPATRQP